MNKLTPEQLEEIKEREKNATIGPWRFTDWSVQTLVGSESEVCNFGIHNNDHCLAGDEPMEDDKIFIAASRTDIPALLDHIKALEEENKQLRKQNGNIMESYRELEYTMRQYREQVGSMNSDGAWWVWMPDEENHLESITCAILIQAEWMRNLLDDARKPLEEENARYKDVLQRLDVANSLEYCKHGGLKFLPCSYCDAERSR